MFSTLRQIFSKSLKPVFVLLAVIPSTMISLYAEPVKNGFDLSNSIIPASQILSGGPPRDGIPAINGPKFISASEVKYLKEEDRVIGVNYAGEMRAYPIQILNWHEIVNDRVNGQSIAVTYCPLCGSGVVYLSTVNGEAYSFGVSGLLYNSDVLLYDRETETLWSQILAKAISGKLVGKALTIIPSSHTSWKSWKKLYPHTKVLSRKTGFDCDYSRSPYGDYEQDRTTYFPVEFSSKRYHPKERVLGITINGKQKVYPFAELAKLEGNSLQDSFAGKGLVLEFDVENRDGQIKDTSGEVLLSMNTFWFAWYAFHPEEEIYSHP